jgi:hypothetical protein
MLKGRGAAGGQRADQGGTYRQASQERFAQGEVHSRYRAVSMIG